MGKRASSLTHALCTSTNSLSVQGHISLPCVLCLASNTFDFLRPRPLTNACVVFQMQPSFASVQKIVGYKCIAPGCDKMFDTRNSYNRHRAHRSHAGSACADIENGRQLISRGPASGDRPKLFSMRIALAQQHGANPGQRL